MTAPVTVLIVDDEQLVRAGLHLILSANDGLDVVGEADDGARAVVEARRLQPDVVLMDLQMPVMNGIDATRRITGGGSTPPRVVVLTTFTQDQLVYDALVAGASGFLLKDMPGAQLVAGVAAIARGEELLAPSVSAG